MKTLSCYSCRQSRIDITEGYLEYNIDQEHLCKDSSGIFVHEGASEYVHSILFSFYFHLSPSYAFSITLIKISFKLISRVISYFRDLHY